MKIEKLTNNKIRIIIDTNDINEFNIEKKHTDLNLYMKDKVGASNLISTVLKHLKKITNFSTSNSKLFIEMFSSENDFIVFIITKILINKKYSSKPSSFGFLYKFNSFNDFSDFCNNLNFTTQKNIIPQHVILYEFKSHYYLYISELSYKRNRLFCNYLLEFASFIDSKELINNKIIEYGKIILKNNTFLNYIKYLNNK